MYSPTSRLLTILELLQARGRLRGTELAERLEVDGRTVRRYITTLQKLGIPIEAERGRYGAYRLRPGFKLPPLLFTDDEALALTLGLLAVRRVGLAATAPAAEGALAKVERVLPLTVRERVQAIGDTLQLDLPPRDLPPIAADLIATLSMAARRGTRVRLRYCPPDAAESERLFDPFGLVHRVGQTYVVGFCHLRQDRRVFRLDRVAEVAASEQTFTPPENFDALAYVLDAIVAAPRAWSVEVMVAAPLERLRPRIPLDAASLTTTPDGVLLRCSTDDLDWFAHILLGLRFPLVVQRPPELRDALRRLAERAVALAAGAEPCSEEGAIRTP